MRALHSLIFVVAALLLLAACQSSEQPTATLAATAVQQAATAGPTVPATSEPTVEPTAVPTEVPTQTPIEEPTATTAPAAAFCPEVPRPALILFIPGEKYVVTDPASGQACDMPFPGPLPGIVQVANEQIYYHVAKENNLVVQRLSPDGTVEDLPYTTLSTTGGLFQNYLVSPDGQYIAWSYAGTKQDDPSMAVSELWIAEMATGQVTAQVEDFSQLSEGLHGLVPVRFSDDDSTLFFARQPIGIGGAWMSFVGRFDNLSSTPTNGGEVTHYFDCVQEGLFLCIGDFYLVNGQVANIVYTNDQAGEVVVRTGDGQVINSLPADMSYVGYPTFSPTAELVYYTAELTEESILPVAASLHRVAPPTAPAEVVVSNPALLLPDRFIDGTRLVVGYAPDESTFGNVVVNLMDGSLTPLSQWPTAMIVAVLP